MEVAPIFITMIPKMTLLVSLAAQVTAEHLRVGLLYIAASAICMTRLLPL